MPEGYEITHRRTRRKCCATWGRMPQTRNERAKALPNPPFHHRRTSAVAHIAEKRTYGIIDLQHRSDIELHVFGVRQKGLVTGSDVADL